MGERGSWGEQFEACAANGDFEGALALINANLDAVVAALGPLGIKEALKKTTDDRLNLSFLEGVGFGQQPPKEVLSRLTKLVSFKPGSLVLNSAWGLGKVKKVDYFYKRVTVDFKSKRGHQFAYLAAVDMLELASEGHVLVLREADPAAFAQMIKERPADVVRAVIRSNGSSMTLIKLEDYCAANGIVRAGEWKAFWDRARVDLKRDKCVVIPVKKTEAIVLRAEAEDYGEGWLTAFTQETDPNAILAAVREYDTKDRFASASEDVREKIGDRLAFAIKAARNTDDALFVRLACTIKRLGYVEPSVEGMRAYLWERRRFIKAASALPAREVGDMISFLASDDEAKAKLFEAIPNLCFAAVSEIVAQYGEDPACRAAVGNYMKEPKAPPVLTTLLVGRYEQFIGWSELPSLITLLTHAIALGEGHQGGETLKMQNIVRRLFSDKKWLEKIFGWLDEQDQALLFERFQASIAWDPSTHHTTVVRMTNIIPSLKGRLVKVEKKREMARITSPRSFALRKAEYLKLINEDMPANVKRIEFAKSYGDLSENAEYQYAKDEQRVLMQKQAQMQSELESVKAGDFAEATTDEVMPGVTVVCATPDGEKVWTILGEWDNDFDLGVISSKALVAQNLIGKKPGDQFELPDAEGGVKTATVVEIRPLSDEIRSWMQIPEGLEI